MKSYITAIFGTVLLMLAWMLIQNLWRSAFSGEMDDEDVLAFRSCGNCGCTDTCTNKNTSTLDSSFNELSN